MRKGEKVMTLKVSLMSIILSNIFIFKEFFYLINIVEQKTIYFILRKQCNLVILWNYFIVFRYIRENPFLQVQIVYSSAPKWFKQALFQQALSQ